MLPVPKTICAALLALAGPFPAAAQRQAPPVVQQPPPAYADYADLVLAAPVIVDGAVRSTARIKGPEAAGVAPGHARFYVEADVLALIRGAQALPARVGYVLDVAADSRGKLPNLKRLRVLIFARAVRGTPGQLQLVRPDAQRPWTPNSAALTRRIAAEAVAPGAAPQITGVGNSFYVPGSLPGEGETQIFLTTADGRPVSLSIVRAPGQQRRWSVSLSDIVDQGSGPPARDTLLWYRLACSLPAALPDPDPSAEGQTAAEDYRFVLDSLGACDRGRR